MKHQIDLTGKKFYNVDFSEAIIVDFYTPHIMPSNFSFAIWGVQMDLSTNNKNTIDKVDGKRWYLSGIGTLSVKNCIGGIIDYSPFCNKKNIDDNIVFTTNPDGTFVNFTKKWGIALDKNWCIGKQDKEYYFEFNISWPPGSGLVTLYIEDSLSFEYDDADLISQQEEYCRNPRKYSFNPFMSAFDSFLS